MKFKIYIYIFLKEYIVDHYRRKLRNLLLGSSNRKVAEASFFFFSFIKKSQGIIRGRVCLHRGARTKRTPTSLWYRWTLSERISCVSLWTVTDRNVIGHATDSQDTTRARAWVSAVVLDTGWTERTVRVNETFGTAACGRRVSELMLGSSREQNEFNLKALYQGF